MIKYIADDLFNAPQDMLLVHACNCQGVWGSGIAKQFKNKFFSSYLMYSYICAQCYFPYEYETNSMTTSTLLGSAVVVNRVGCLFTSFDYGLNVDDPETILINTREAIKDLLTKTTMKIAMPKINSGLFKVPWEETEKILNEFPHVEFYVYTGVEK